MFHENSLYTAKTILPQTVSAKKGLKICVIDGFSVRGKVQAIPDGKFGIIFNVVKVFAEGTASLNIVGNIMYAVVCKSDVYACLMLTSGCRLTVRVGSFAAGHFQPLTRCRIDAHTALGTSENVV